MKKSNDLTNGSNISLEAAPATQINLSAHIKQLKTEGWCAIEGILSPEESSDALTRLWSAAKEYRKRGGATHMEGLDPNDANVRIFELLALDRYFWTLIRKPIALELVRALLGKDIIVSNFTANIARPGAGSMSLHSDQSFIAPEPWVEPWAMNIIWCLTDVRFENGATLYIPGSQNVTRFDELGDQPTKRLRAFEAPAGSIIAMDGRMWHTSGKNITENEDRAMLFAYYSRGFLRQQYNWSAGLPKAMQQEMDDDLRTLLGLNPYANNELAARVLTTDYSDSHSTN